MDERIVYLELIDKNERVASTLVKTSLSKQQIQEKVNKIMQRDNADWVNVINEIGKDKDITVIGTERIYTIYLYENGKKEVKDTK